MAGYEAVLEYAVERMLHAGKALGGVVVLVVYVYVVVADGFANFGREQIIVDERLCSFAGEFHHHACRRVGIHVGVLTGDIVVLGLDDFVEHVGGLGTAGNATLVAICYIAFGHFLAG